MWCAGQSVSRHSRGKGLRRLWCSVGIMGIHSLRPRFTSNVSGKKSFQNQKHEFHHTYQKCMWWPPLFSRVLVFIEYVVVGFMLKVAKSIGFYHSDLLRVPFFHTKLGSSRGFVGFWYTKHQNDSLFVLSLFKLLKGITDLGIKYTSFTLWIGFWLQTVCFTHCPQTTHWTRVPTTLVPSHWTRVSASLVLGRPSVRVFFFVFSARPSRHVISHHFTSFHSISHHFTSLLVKSRHFTRFLFPPLGVP